MIKAPVPKNERDRLASLRRYKVLDTQSEFIFDEITKLAAQICQTKIALISLVDEKRQWFKSHYGTDAEQAPRDLSLCGYAILNDDIFVVEDTSKDERFFDNPLVLSLKARFYAGMPLLTPQGYRIGTLCVIDYEPKSLNKLQRSTLKSLSMQVINILELNLKNEELLQTQSQLLDVQKISKTGGWELEKSSMQVTWTDQIYSIHGLEKVEGKHIPVKNAMNFYAENERVRISNYVETALTEGKSFNDVFEFYDKNNHKKWVRAIGKPIMNEHGETIKLSGTFQDITRTHEDKLLLRKQSHFLKNTLDNFDGQFYAIDIKGRFIFANKEFLSFNKRKSSYRKKFTKLVSKEKYAFYLKENSTVLVDKETIQYDNSIESSSGNQLHFRVFKFPYLDKNNEVYAIGSILLDITEKMEMERQLSHNLKLASIGELAAGIGHEINNPLMIIDGYISKFYSKGEEHTSIPIEVLARISKSTQRISNIVNGLRTFSRMDTTGKENSFSAIDSTEETLNLIKEIFHQESISLSFKKEKSIGKIFIKGDGGKFQQILVNILTNAKDALSRIRDKKIEVRIFKEDKNIFIHIKDNGHGISEKDRSKIFNPFFTTKDIGEGTGIGLSLVHKFVQELNGSICVSSKMGQETTFKIKLPIYKDREQKVRTLKQAQHRGPESLRILVAEDEVEIQNLLQDILQEMGHNVICADDGQEALSIYKENSQDIDLIISDIKMPNMDGFELLKSVKAMSHPIKFIAITGGVNIDLANKKAKTNQGIDGNLLKPFSDREVQELLSKVIPPANNSIHKSNYLQ